MSEDRSAGQESEGGAGTGRGGQPLALSSGLRHILFLPYVLFQVSGLSFFSFLFSSLFISSSSLLFLPLVS